MRSPVTLSAGTSVEAAEKLQSLLSGARAAKGGDLLEGRREREADGLEVERSA